ncbi:MAG: hypothetical protein H0T78_06065 [Longispora sp.]|nr:hypothetical protein [Longispora sp. (in: high G+C Gram-positive bacteria)]
MSQQPAHRSTSGRTWWRLRPQGEAASDDNPQARRFEIFQDEGLGGKFARHMLDDARENGRVVLPYATSSRSGLPKVHRFRVSHAGRRHPTADCGKRPGRSVRHLRGDRSRYKENVPDSIWLNCRLLGVEQ